FRQSRAGGGATRVGVLDDSAEGLVHGKFLREVPRSLQVNDVVIGKLFALKLTRIGYSRFRAIAVHGSALMWILAVAQVGDFAECKAQCRRKFATSARQFAAGFSNALER